MRTRPISPHEPSVLGLGLIVTQLSGTSGQSESTKVQAVRAGVVTDAFVSLVPYAGNVTPSGRRRLQGRVDGMRAAAPARPARPTLHPSVGRP